ncbi:MAG: LPS export ABC transporter permease LptF [Magnetococcales bacterium]|nr:LPS export ABC transporter permease LptF [Magnetococcales bacterium]
MRISRYLFRETFQTALLALLVFTGLILLPQVLRLVDLWVNKGTSVADLGLLILYLTPKFLVASLPIALLVGILIGLGRLVQDSEIVVLKSCGFSLFQISRPIALLILIFASFSWMLNGYWIPAAQGRMVQLKTAILSAVTFSLKPQSFSQLLPGLTIYIQDQDAKTRRFKGLIIHDERNARMPVTLVAAQGRMVTLPDGNSSFFLEEGIRQQVTSSGLRQMGFQSFTLDLDLSPGGLTTSRQTSFQELSAAALEEAMNNPHRALEARMEWHRRIAFPAATLILGFLAIPMSLQTSQRGGRGFGFLASLLILVAHFLLLTLGETLAKRALITPPIGFWLPNGLMAGLTLYLFRQSARDKPVAALVLLGQLLDFLPATFARPARSDGGTV